MAGEAPSAQFLGGGHAHHAKRRQGAGDQNRCRRIVAGKKRGHRLMADRFDHLVARHQQRIDGDAGQGVLQTQVLQGDVPSGARIAEVEIRFEHSAGAGSGDAYADNLSLEFLP